MVHIAITAFGVARKIKSLCGLPIGSKCDIQNMNICKEYITRKGEHTMWYYMGNNRWVWIEIED